MVEEAKELLTRAEREARNAVDRSQEGGNGSRTGRESLL